MSAPLRVTGVDLVLAGGRRLLDGVDVTFPAGSMTALSGPSGSGKTTLVSVAGGLLEPTRGTTDLDGTPMWRGTGDPRPEVAFVLQVYGLVPILSAAENVEVALRARGVDPDDAAHRALTALARFGIADLADRQVEELSGGQMQRVALARGLAVGARVLLADEPTSELDEANRALVLAELRAEADRGTVVVVATHDPAVVEACDHHVVIDEGRVVDHVEPVHLGPEPGGRTPGQPGKQDLVGGCNPRQRPVLPDNPRTDGTDPAPDPAHPDDEPDHALFRRPAPQDPHG